MKGTEQNGAWLSAIIKRQTLEAEASKKRKRVLFRC